MLIIVLSCCLIGLIAGLLAGLFGIGGGLIIVPSLVMVFSSQHFPESSSLLQAVATSLATIVLTALSSVYAHHRLGAVLWFKVWRLAPMIMLGAGLGAVVAEQLPVVGLRLVIVVFLLYAGLQLVLSVKAQPGVKKQSVWLDSLAASAIGLLSAIVGIGGGTLTVPYLVYGGFEMRQAVAVSSACGLPIAVAGTISYALLGLTAQNLPEYSVGYIYGPAFIAIGLCSIVTAPFGAKLAHRLPSAKLKRYFSVLLFASALKLLFS